MVIYIDSHGLTRFYGTTDGHYKILPTSIAQHLLEFTDIPHFDGVPLIIFDFFGYRIKGQFILMNFLYIHNP